MLPPGVPGCQYEAERSRAGLTSLAGLPLYLGLVVASGPGSAIRRQMRVAGHQGGPDLRLVPAVVRVHCAGGLHADPPPGASGNLGHGCYPDRDAQAGCAALRPGVQGASAVELPVGRAGDDAVFGCPRRSRSGGARAAAGAARRPVASSARCDQGLAALGHRRLCRRRHWRTDPEDAGLPANPTPAGRVRRGVGESRRRRPACTRLAAVG